MTFNRMPADGRRVKPGWNCRPPVILCAFQVESDECKDQASGILLGSINKRREMQQDRQKLDRALALTNLEAKW